MQKQKSNSSKSEKTEMIDGQEPFVPINVVLTEESEGTPRKELPPEEIFHVSYFKYKQMELENDEELKTPMKSDQIKNKDKPEIQMSQSSTLFTATTKEST